MQGINGEISNQVFLAIPKISVSAWHGLLRRGVGVFLEKAVSVRDLMTDVLGMDPQYATNSVPGLFLNNAPVDDWREERVGGGARAFMQYLEDEDIALDQCECALNGAPVDSARIREVLAGAEGDIELKMTTMEG
jgi:hypothetical protein